MITRDIRFDKKTLELLQLLVGQELEYFACERLEYTSSVYGMVVFAIGNKLYRITNLHERLEYFNSVDDVGVCRFEETNEDAVQSFLEGGELIKTPVKQRIKEIRIMNENQQLYHRGKQTYDMYTVRGIVFVMEDGREISVEKEIWFSEMITVRAGRNLMDEFESMDDFLGNWVDSQEYQTDGSREILILK